MVYVVKEKTNEVKYTIPRKDGTEEIVYKEKFIGVVNEQPKRLTLPLNTIVGKCPKFFRHYAKLKNDGYARFLCYTLSNINIEPDYEQI